MLNDIAFNQDFTCFLVSTTTEHKIYNCDPFGVFHSLQNKDPQNGPTSFLRMLFSTSLIIRVPHEADEKGSRRLEILNLKQNLRICELTFPLKVLDLKLNRKRLVVFTELGQIYIYDLSCIRLLKMLEMQSLAGLQGELSVANVTADLSSDDSSYLVIPLLMVTEHTDLFNEDDGAAASGTTAKDQTSLDQFIQYTPKMKDSAIAKKQKITYKDLQQDSDGWVLVYDTILLKPKLIYKAHDSMLAKIAISNSSDKIATASHKGTLIRVCQLEETTEENTTELKLTLLISLRRGLNSTLIDSLAFSLDLAYLACASEGRSVHLFALGQRAAIEGDDSDAESTHSTDHEHGLQSEAESRGALSSLEDLNENLANLLILKPHEEPAQAKKEKKSYLGSWKTSSKLLSNSYTKLIMKRLPYKNYIEDLVWEKPRRSFAYVKLPAGHLAHVPHRSVEIGFPSSGLMLLASYSLGCLYQYELREPAEGERQQCKLMRQDRFYEEQ